MAGFLTRLKKFGIPNMLSVVRLLLIPIFVGIYFSNSGYSGAITACILILSGITDILDGIIARKFHMTSALGKMLDPLADKLTQAMVCVCLVIRRVAPLWLLLIFILKEIAMIAGGANIIRKGKELISSKWFGKLSTVVFYIVMIFIIAWNPNRKLAELLIAVSLLFMLFSLFMYIPIFLKVVSNKEREK